MQSIVPNILCMELSLLAIVQLLHVVHMSVRLFNNVFAAFFMFADGCKSHVPVCMRDT